MEVLPIDVREIATSGLALTYQERDQIGTVPSHGLHEIDVSGLMDRNNKVIEIAARLPQETRRFTAAHEIGHFVLHRQSLLRESPATDAHLRSPFRSPFEREADIFAAELLMPEKAVREVFQRLFGGPVNGSEIDEAQFFVLGDPEIDITAFRKLDPVERAKLVARAESRTFRASRPMTEIFGVSVQAMAYRLRDLDLVA